MKESELERLRKHLDGLDDRLIDLLAERAAAVKAIWALKQQHQLGLVDPAREAAIFARLAERARARGLQPAAVAEVLRAVVGKKLDQD